MISEKTVDNLPGTVLRPGKPLTVRISHRASRYDPKSLARNGEGKYF